MLGSDVEVKVLATLPNKLAGHLGKHVGNKVAELFEGHRPHHSPVRLAEE
jgi:hypothetical protein